MPFIPHTESDIKEMQHVIGVKKITELFDEIPKNLVNANIDAMENGCDEMAVKRLAMDRAPFFKPGTCFLGAGAYEHDIPAAVWDIVTRGEFYTAYTPYQPEASQGTLEVIYEYQTMMTKLMAMEVSNASLYDGASALAEAVLMAARLSGIRDQGSGIKVRVLVPINLHPNYRSVLKTIINPTIIELIDWEYNPKTGCVDLTQLKQTVCDAIIISQPNFFGCIEEVDALTNLAHEKNALVIGVVNPIATALLTPPGQWGKNGADIACGEGQPLGVPLFGGGPYFGFLCCRKKDIRQLPGRIVGKTTDVNGKTGFVLTLQAREQHIRRAKATSNICTNQGLLVTAATIYMRLLGAKGLQAVAQQSAENTEKLKKLLSSIDGVNIIFNSPTFHEFVITTEKPIQELVEALQKNHIQAGLMIENYFPELKNSLLICVTETKTDDDLLNYVKSFSNKTIPPFEKGGRLRSNRGDFAIPHTAELDVVRHFTKLSQKNFSIETNFYPLGSCTMKYNPRAAKAIASLPGNMYLHPLTDAKQMQGHLENLYELQNMIATLTGFEAVSLTPMAGAQGEFAGVAMIAAYHRDRKDFARTEMLIPDAAHGTNPASARMCGFTVKEIPTCTKTGDIDLGALEKAVSEKTAGIMLTNPSTFGVFERKIEKIAEIVHKAGGLLYYDGANLNAILGHARPGDMGFDVMHLNCHKTFATPHGGGGPGSGPVAANARLKEYLPTPIVGISNSVNGSGSASDHYHWVTQQDRPKSIGRLSCFMGNTGVLLRAHTYLKLLGKNGAKRVSEFATLNANYLMKQLEKIGYTLAFPDRRASHEFIITAKPLMQKTGVSALDIAKRLLDFGIYAPTIYFPLLISECLLIEPTETENKKTLDRFVEVMKIIYDEAHTDPAKLKGAPYTTPVGRLDEVKAARELTIRD